MMLSISSISMLQTELIVPGYELHLHGENQIKFMDSINCYSLWIRHVWL